MKVAIVVGHKESSAGAYNNASGVSEYVYNERLASIIATTLRNSKIDIEIVYRGTYSRLPEKINNLQPDYIISLHCNAYNRKASGTETLYYYKSDKGLRLASAIQKSVCNTLGLWDRGVKPKSSEDRGGYLLRYTKAPCVILESFFIDNNSDYIVGVNHIEGLALAITDVIEDLA